MREGLIAPNDEQSGEGLKSIFHRSHSMDRGRQQRGTSRENIGKQEESPKLSKIRRRLSVEGIKINN